MTAELITLKTAPYYYLAPQDGDGSGSLLLADATGDTLLPPYDGRYTWLDSVTSEEDAELMAQSWEAQK